MAVRTPLKWNGTGLQEMSSAEITAIKNQITYLWSTNASSTVGYVSSGGGLGNISDTRMRAGTSSTDVTNYHTEAETAEPSTGTVNYARMTNHLNTAGAVSDTSNIAFPLYFNGGSSLKSMSLTDMYDTFIYPAVNMLVDGSDRPGTYRIHSSTSLSNHSLISSTPIFTDTRANVGAYTAAGIAEAIDQPTTIANYYLFKTNGSAFSYPVPVHIRSSDSQVQQYSASAFNTVLLNLVRYVARNVGGYRIRYSVSSGNTRGSGMVNTKLNGSGNYQVRYVNTNDYRAQEFPNGTAVTVATKYLRIYKV
jgi:hypothetical protein